MKRIIATVAVIVTLVFAGGAVWAAAHGEEEKTPIDWAKEEIRSDEKYEGKTIMWIVTPVEDETLGKNEALYIIIAMTEKDELVMDYYGVYIRQKKDAERVIRKDVFIDADIIKTEAFKK